MKERTKQREEISSSQEQYIKFVDIARSLGCDESESAFDATLSKLAKQPPAPKPAKKDKPGK